MARYLTIALAVLVTSAVAWAGGPPPMYVVVDKVVLEPSADAAERIRIEGSFVRLENIKRYEYGKPIHGYVYMSIENGKETECTTEWAKWQKAAGTGKVVSVGSCGEAGSLLTVKIHQPAEKADRPDAAYVSGVLGRFGSVYADGDFAQEHPVTDLLTFVKERKPTEPATRH
jgi:hypothetical protein